MTATTQSHFDSSITIGFAASMSNPAVKYEIKRGANGHIYCSCPAWRYQKLPPMKRTCKHLKALAAGRLLLAE